MICGLVSEYKLNRVYGETRPGLVKVCSVEPFQEMLKKLHTKEAAEEKAREEKEKQAQSAFLPDSKIYHRISETINWLEAQIERLK